MSQIKLDWLSFSLFHEDPQPLTTEGAIHCAFAVIADRVGDEAYKFFDAQKWEWSGGRKPYSGGVRNADAGISVYVNHRLPHFLVEFSGRGMERLFQSDFAAPIIESIADRVTRIDVAVDMETDVDPRAFAAAKEPGRFKASSEMVSESGITCYIGSRTSDRYARVYRYSPPHPRSHLLRAEHVFKGDEAKTTLTYLMENTWSALATQCQKMFGWKHEAWTLEDVEAEPLTTYRADRPDAKTLFWLHKTVAPVLARLEREGKLSTDEFLAFCKSLNDGLAD